MSISEKVESVVESMSKMEVRLTTIFPKTSRYYVLIFIVLFLQMNEVVHEVTESICEKTIESVKVTKESMEHTTTETITNGVSVRNPCKFLLIRFTNLSGFCRK